MHGRCKGNERDGRAGIEVPALPQGQVDGGVRGLETKLPPRGDGVAEVVPACVLPLRERCPRRSSVDDQRLSPFLSLEGTGIYASIARNRICREGSAPVRLGRRRTLGSVVPRSVVVVGPVVPGSLVAIVRVVRALRRSAALAAADAGGSSGAAVR